MIHTNKLYNNQYASLLNSLFPSFVRGLVNNKYNQHSNLISPVLSGVGAPNSAWRVMFQRWEPVVHLNGGTLALKEANTKYLPKGEGEADGVYFNRLARSVLFGAYSRTVKTLSGMPFMTPMSFTNLPEDLNYLVKDATGEGQSLAAFAKELLQDQINFGIAHVLVEYPQVDTSVELTQEDEKLRNLHPYFCRIDPMRLIGWNYELVGCKKVLTEVRLFEDIIEENDKWEEQHIKQVRVITPGVTTIYRLEEKMTDWQEHEVIITSNSSMELVTIYGNRTGFMQGAPVLEELAHLNISHWNKSSDLDNIEHVINVPMAYAFGLQEGEFENITFSPHSMLKSGNPDLKVGYLEHSGQAIPASQVSLANVESRMMAMGAEMLAPRGTGTRETGIAKTIDNTKATSVLQELVESLEDGVERLLNLAGAWLDVVVESKVNIGDKISLTVDANLITNMIDLARQGNMTFEELTLEFQKRGLISDATVLTQSSLPVVEAGNTEPPTA
jgi:hypothetical protein